MESVVIPKSPLTPLCQRGNKKIICKDVGKVISFEKCNGLPALEKNIVLPPLEKGGTGGFENILIGVDHFELCF